LSRNKLIETLYLRRFFQNSTNNFSKKYF